MVKVKAFELRKKEEKDLLEELNKYRSELSKLRVSKVSAAAQVRLAQIRVVRKSIARVLTVITEKRRDLAKAENKGKKFKPVSIRKRGTRKSRRELSKHLRSLTTLKHQKRIQNWPQRKFALAA